LFAWSSRDVIERPHHETPQQGHRVLRLAQRESLLVSELNHFSTFLLAAHQISGDLDFGHNPVPGLPLAWEPCGTQGIFFLADCKLARLRESRIPLLQYEQEIMSSTNAALIGSGSSERYTISFQQLRSWTLNQFRRRPIQKEHQPAIQRFNQLCGKICSFSHSA